ncbi:UDP-glucuronate decarboxylase [Rhodovulum iodosum]|uniref:UDP-glucuronate decarboxylase n=1 Tax=Rhodovulum iodosum TaxID=68291 RepID=A0ABV3XTV7_9RHOB|nr:UDP-glucuronic acid decarboxylase family protein [Rhodovulum robiginosum]RSK32201.1 SDR family oxidoreductase [Rhodovulum robiginosum]
MSGKTILVTGGAGFLGSHLCDRLIEAGNRVICIDSLVTGSKSNVTQLMGRRSFEFIEHDIIEPLAFGGEIDQIYNLACPASPIKYELDPLHTFKTSVYGAMNMLEMAREKNAKILQASTSEVYGDPSVSPQPERYFGNVNTVGPRSCYDEGKRAAETLFHDFHERFGVETRIARIFNTYGPRMSPDDGRVVSNFIVQALTGQDLTVYGDGEQTRSFCYVDDLVDGLCRLMASGPETYMPVNMGNPGEFTVGELARLVLDKTGASPRIVYRDLPQDDPHRRKPDITSARTRLGWEPRVPLSEGLDRTIAYFAALLTRAEETAERVS